MHEIRTRALNDLDWRLDARDDQSRFTGHAAVFSQRTGIGDPFSWGWFEEIAPGSFRDTLASPDKDQAFLVDHDTSLLVARRSVGDLRLAEDGVGLAVDADLDQELSYVRDLTRNLDKRRLTGMSFGFMVPIGGSTWTQEEVVDDEGRTRVVDVRTITAIDLWEVSAVTFPAYPQTDAGLRSACIEVRSAAGVDFPDVKPDLDSEPRSASPLLFGRMRELAALHRLG